MDLKSYEDIRIMHVKYLESLLAGQGSTKDIYERIDEKIDRYASGDSDHAVYAITLLWKLSKAGGCLVSPPRSSIVSSLAIFFHD